MEHNRPEGLCQGYYCLTCGEGGLNMYGMNATHNNAVRDCPNEPNPELVAILRELNK